MRGVKNQNQADIMTDNSFHNYKDFLVWVHTGRVERPWCM